jgi:hypothetical protein
VTARNRRTKLTTFDDERARLRSMGRYDFDFGYNVQPIDAVPEYPTAATDRDGGDVEDNDMIPRGNNNNDQQSGQRGKRKGSGLRYLSADMLSSTHQTASIVDARVEQDTFRQGQTVVTVKIKFKGEFLLWSLRPGNPNLDTLGDAMGDDEKTWKGHDVELYIEEDTFNGKKWMRSEVVPTTTKRR